MAASSTWVPAVCVELQAARPLTATTRSNVQTVRRTVCASLIVFLLGS
jgi:hypothetical protein